MDWHYTISGLLVGMIVGMTGVGGGSLMTPLLVMVFGVSPATAIGTDLLYAGVTKASGSWLRSWLGSIRWHIAGWLAVGSVPAAIATSALMSKAQLNSEAWVGLIKTSLGVALLITAVTLLIKPRTPRVRTVGHRPVEGWRMSRTVVLTVIWGGVLGVLVTLTSVGAGALGAVVLLTLYPELSTNHVAGTDIAHAVPLTLIAGAGHAAIGTVDYGMLGSLLVGSIPGILVGSLYAHKLPEKTIRIALSAVLFAVGIKLVI